MEKYIVKLDDILYCRKGASIYFVDSDDKRNLYRFYGYKTPIYGFYPVVCLSILRDLADIFHQGHEIIFE